MKKFNGHRCERRNLTDLVLGTGPDGKPRPKPKAKKRPKNFTKEPAANKKYFGGPFVDPNQMIQGNPSLGYGMTLPDPLAGIVDPFAEDEIAMDEEDFPLDFTQASLRRDRRQFDRAQKIAAREATKAAAEGVNPGQVPGKMADLLEDDAKAAAISAGGQALGEFVTGLDKNASDPGSKFGVGEGAGALIKGATNPLAMTFGPAGMVAGAALNLGASVFKHKKEKDEFERLQEEARQERVANEMAAAQSFSDQVLQTYSQEGVGGGLYARHGGPVDRFYTGGPTEPPAVMPGMEQYAQYANLNPELANAVANMPARNEGLMKGYTDQQLARNERLAEQARIKKSLENIAARTKDIMSNPDVAMDAGQLALQGIAASDIPVASQAAGGINTAMYAGRAGYKAYKGDYVNAGIYGGLAGLSGLGMVPVLGTAADLTAADIAAGIMLKQGSKGMRVLSSPGAQRAIHGAEHVEHVLHPAITADKATNVATGGRFKPMYEATGSLEKGGPVDYETEKSEVILASPNDPPVAVGQGKYTQVSENLYRAKGPSHKHGGIPTRGATEPFVDNMGMYNDSPYVFSDAKEMRFDPSEILSMIA